MRSGTDGPEPNEFERARSNRDLGPSSTAPGPQGVPVAPPAPPGPGGRPGVGREGEFAVGEAAAQDVSGEMLGHRGSPNHSYSYPGAEPRTDSFGRGGQLPSAIHRTDETVAPVDASGGP